MNAIQIGRQVTKGDESTRQSPKHQSNVPLQQDAIQMDTENYLPYELPQKLTPHRQNNDQIPQAYPFRHSPSQMSQMSAITTPSCFPQDYFVPGSAQRMLGDLQQPVLFSDAVGNKDSPIGLENKSGDSPGIRGTGERLSAFSPRLEAENQRQREQLGSMARKLEEKDAIISQLMKRISDLESMNISGARGAKLEYTINTEIAAPPSSVSTLPHDAGARSHRSTDDSFGMSPVWEHSHQSTARGSSSSADLRQPATPLWSNSGDTESACLSVPSPLQLGQHQSIQKQPSLQQQAQQRRGRSSLSITATSSTASITTSNSSKSGRRSAPRSRSVSDSTRPTKNRRDGPGKKMNDDRKFVC